MLLPCYQDGTVHFVNEPLLFRKDGQILGHFDVLFVQHQQFDMFSIALAAEQKTDGIFFVRLFLVLFKILEIEFHLAFVFRFQIVQLIISTLLRLF